MMIEIIKEVPYFNDLKKKELFVTVIGALTLRLISLAKASELLQLEKDNLISLLELIDIRFSYLENEDIEIERDFSK